MDLLPTLRAYGGLRVRDARPVRDAGTLGRLGPLEIRLARHAADVRRAQRLRYRVFFEEGAALPHAPTRLARRDVDRFDGVCDHLLVLDHANLRPSGRPTVAATCRLLRQDVAERHGGFYSANEFDIGALLKRDGRRTFGELGRACVLAPYRNKRTVELLWHGIWACMLRHRIDVMIGCGSLEGTNPDALALPLSFLHHFAAAPPAWHARALPRRRVDMNRLPKSAIDPKTALRALPPLIKGYLRLGALVGDGAVIDRRFGTTDVLIVLPVAAINARYVEHFGAEAERHAA
jgi:putative hemolysin